MLQKLKDRKQEGFTIIEVLIVLAIAGLIMLIVFLAVPALERNQRNSARKSDASHIASAVGDFVSNNGGALPGFESGTFVSATAATDAKTIWTDAGGSTGLSQYGDISEFISSDPTNGAFDIESSEGPWTAPTNINSNTLVLLVPGGSGADGSGWVCNGATAAYTGTDRNAVLMYSLEPWGTWTCLTAQ